MSDLIQIKIKKGQNGITHSFTFTNWAIGMEQISDEEIEKIADGIGPMVGTIHQLKHFADLMDQEYFTMSDWNNLKNPDNAGWGTGHITEEMVRKMIKKFEIKKNIDVRRTECECEK
jgi:hypothetical protein